MLRFASWSDHFRSDIFPENSRSHLSVLIVELPVEATQVFLETRFAFCKHVVSSALTAARTPQRLR